MPSAASLSSAPPPLLSALPRHPECRRLCPSSPTPAKLPPTSISTSGGPLTMPSRSEDHLATRNTPMCSPPPLGALSVAAMVIPVGRHISSSRHRLPASPARMRPPVRSPRHGGAEAPSLCPPRSTGAPPPSTPVRRHPPSLPARVPTCATTKRE
uniref:Uncharacterized protein n=1 Tax=Arundo donax TaxID=35708 RepID=A0A0A9DLE6_ARUDO